MFYDGTVCITKPNDIMRINLKRWPFKLVYKCHIIRPKTKCLVSGNTTDHLFFLSAIFKLPTIGKNQQPLKSCFFTLSGISRFLFSLARPEMAYITIATIELYNHGGLVLLAIHFEKYVLYIFQKNGLKHARLINLIMEDHHPMKRGDQNYINVGEI